MNEHELSRGGRLAADDAVGRLLTLAGARPVLPPERAARLKAAVRPAWNEAVRQEAQRRRFPGRRWPRRRMWVWAAGLAAAASVVWLIVARPVLQPHPVLSPASSAATLIAATGPVAALEAPASDTAFVPGAALTVGSGLDTGEARAALQLANGAVVRLDRGTRLQLLDAERIALQRGGTYIDTEGADIGVEVITPAGRVRDIGTRFEVRLVPAGLRVRIRDGAVVLEHERGSYEGRRGEELQLRPDSSLTRSAVERFGEAWSWTLGILPAPAMDGASLADFLHWVEGETGWHIRFTDPALEASSVSTQVHGDIQGLAPRTALDVVLPACGVAYQLHGGELILEPAP